MKKIYFLLFLIAPFIAKTQMKTWENFSYDEIDHPFKFQDTYSPQNIDSKGNRWVLNSSAILKISNTDTTKFQNFPTTNTAYRYNVRISILGEEIAFQHYEYKVVNYTSSYINYLGYYDGTEMKFFSESVMNTIVSTASFSGIQQTRDYIWITKSDKIIGFDKKNTFTSYTAANSIIKNPITHPQLIRHEPDEIILKNQADVYLFKDQNGYWEKLLPTDSILMSHIAYTRTIYIAGENKIYSYADKILKSYDVPDIESLGNPKQIEELKKNTFVVSYEKGFVLVDNDQTYVKFFADFDGNNYSFGPHDGFFHYLDNGMLILKFWAEPISGTKLYFSFYNNELQFECSKTVVHSNRSPFFYKSLNGETYYCYWEDSEYPQPLKLYIEKNYSDITAISCPQEVLFIQRLHIDSNHIWILNENHRDILRMKRDQYFVRGNVYYDSNQNGQKETTEVGVSKYPVRINPSGLLVYPDRNGDFAFAGESGAKYTMEMPDAALFNYISKPLPYTFAESDNNQIGITLANPEPEVKTNFITPWPRCGTTRTTTLTIENTGFEPIDKVRLALIKDPASEVHAVDAIKKTDTLIFELNHLLPQAPRSLSYEVTYPGAEMTGEKLTFRLITSIYDGENIVKSVADSITDIVRCSYDPNDKSVTPAGVQQENYTLKNSTLNYLIRFENTGNDTAYTVTIHDTLDTHLNLSSFEVLGASHKVITQLSEEGVLVFHFEDIMLPDNKTDEVKAHGFVRFAISPKPDLPENTLVKNQAAIVFDANPPIITNETFNTLVTTLPVITSLQQKKVSKLLYPNPANDVVHINSAHTSHVEVFDATGKQSENIHGNKINTSSWEQGIYLFRVFDANGNMLGTEKIQIVK